MGQNPSECGSRGGNRAEIKSWGGARPGAGRKPKSRGEAAAWPEGPRWYCAQTFPGAEYLALSELWKQQFRAYLPCMIPEGSTAIEPLFRSYVFVPFDVARDPWQRITGTRGVRRLFSTAPERPTPLPVGVVERIMNDGRAGDGVIDRRQPMASWIDAPVRVLCGPFANFQGLCRMAGADRVQALIEVFGRATLVDLDRAHVERI